MPGFICPKCGAGMRAYERRGVTVEQCVGCRGIYLDKGELERLTGAEAAYYDRGPRYRLDDDDDRYRPDDDDDAYARRGERPRMRRGFLDDLLDFG
jgi:Zn-finger nucleic acid-binding protein